MKHYTYPHVAFLCKDRKLIAIGQNRAASSIGPAYTIHAEVDAIQSVGDTSKLRGATLIVIRLAATGILNSKPCHACQRLIDKCIKRYGLRGYIYSA